MRYDDIQRDLRALADEEYKIFNDRLSKSAYPSLGVRIPELRTLAKRLFRENSFAEITEYQPDTFEGVILKGFMLGNCTDYETFVTAWDAYLPLFDSWAQTDTTVSSLKIMKTRAEDVLAYYLPLKNSEKEFDKRFLILLTMDYLIDDAHIDAVLNLWTEIPTGQYYTDMALAWALSVGLVKFYGKTLAVLKENRFSVFVHNKAIQKARESYRISAEQKAELSTLKRG